MSKLPGVYQVGDIAFTIAFRACPCVQSLWQAYSSRHAVAPPPVLVNYKQVRRVFRPYMNEIADIFKHRLIDFELGEWTKPFTKTKVKQLLEEADFTEADYSQFKVMTKIEVYPAMPELDMVTTVITYKGVTKLRNIQFVRHADAQVTMAPYYGAAQKAAASVLNGDLVKKYTNSQGQDVYIKLVYASGLLNNEIAQILQDGLEGKDFPADLPWDPHIVESDNKNHDATMQAPHSEFMYWFYKELGFPDAIIDNIRKGNDAYMSHHQHDKQGDGVIRIKIRHTTKSGIGDTTNRNTLNVMAIVADACIKLGLSAVIVVAGDDCIAIINRYVDFAILQGLINKYGVKCEGRVFSDLCDCTFISSAFFARSDGGYVMNRIPGRALARMPYTVSLISKRKKRHYCKGVALSQASGLMVPILRALIIRMYPPIRTMTPEKIGRSFNKTIGILGVEITRDWLRTNRHVIKEPTLLAQTTIDWMQVNIVSPESVGRRYDLSAQDILDFEELILQAPAAQANSYGHEHFVLKHEIAELIMARDGADPASRITA